MRVTLTGDYSGGVDDSDNDGGTGDGDGYAGADDAFPDNRDEWVDTDGDAIGNNAHTDGYTDLHELEMGADPLDSKDMPRSGGLSPALIRVISQEVKSDDGSN